MKNCIACGMPIEKKEDFAMGDPDKNYCRFCANPDGTMQSFEQKKKGLSEFIMKTQGLDSTAALKAAETAMRRLPAWQDCF